MHATAKEAKAETLRMFKVYEDFQKDYLALPVITGKKTEKEKFAGAEETYTLEAMMYDGMALQNGTSHYFGQHFANAFGIKFINKDNEYVTPYQTSWGVTTRMIGAVIMTHGDDRGLVLPPKIAPIKVDIIPIGDVESKLSSITKTLSDNAITYKVDNSEKTPGFKFAEAEVKGYPIRIELGKRDLASGFITLVRRDTLERIQVTDYHNLVNIINDLLEDIQKNLYNRAKLRRDSMIYQAHTFDEFKSIAKTKPGFIKINWCGDEACENKIKDETGMKSRCLISNEAVDDVCCVCGKKAVTKIYFGRQY
ncbi:MAG: His/Gly/Thr/Pro-type tRNA ligase C-terminal domain-containing protein, partial [Erysipelotrichaceae bacterium]